MAEMIYSAINAVMSEIGSIGKEKRSQQGYMYRGIDDVMNALNPSFIKNKVFAVPEVMEQIREERSSNKGNALIYSVCKVKYTFYAEDGSHVDVVTVGEGMDSGDKATNKAMAIAFKYACFQLFCIPTVEMVDDTDARPVDPDRESHELSSNKGESHNVQRESKKITDAQMQDLYNECRRTGQHWKGVCTTYFLETFSDMNEEQYIDAMNRFKKLPDKPKEKPPTGSTS